MSTKIYPLSRKNRFVRIMDDYQNYDIPPLRIMGTSYIGRMFKVALANPLFHGLSNYTDERIRTLEMVNRNRYWAREINDEYNAKPLSDYSIGINIYTDYVDECKSDYLRYREYKKRRG